MGVDDDKLFGLLVQEQLLVGLAHVQFREQFPTSQFSEEIFNLGNWILIEL